MQSTCQSAKPVWVVECRYSTIVLTMKDKAGLGLSLQVGDRFAHRTAPASFTHFLTIRPRASALRLETRHVHSPRTFTAHQPRRVFSIAPTQPVQRASTRPSH